MLEESIIRRDEICDKFQCETDRYDKAFEYLKTQKGFSDERVVVDYLESCVKQLYFGSIEKLPGE